jgi:hypothetical protein
MPWEDLQNDIEQLQVLLTGYKNSSLSGYRQSKQIELSFQHGRTARLGIAYVPCQPFQVVLTNITDRWQTNN